MIGVSSRLRFYQALNFRFRGNDGVRSVVRHTMVRHRFSNPRSPCRRGVGERGKKEITLWLIKLMGHTSLPAFGHPLPQGEREPLMPEQPHPHPSPPLEGEGVSTPRPSSTPFEKGAGIS